MSDADPSVVLRASLPDDGQLVDYNLRSEISREKTANQDSGVNFSDEPVKLWRVAAKSIFCQKTELEHSPVCIAAGNCRCEALMQVDLHHLELRSSKQPDGSAETPPAVG